MTSLGERIRNRPQGPNNVCHWMFWAKWYWQFRKGTASGVLRFVRYEQRKADTARTKFHPHYVMLGARRLERFKFFLGSNAYVARRPCAGRLRLRPARWI
jgi:hypothetical protein